MKRGISPKRPKIVPKCRIIFDVNRQNFNSALSRGAGNELKKRLSDGTINEKSGESDSPVTEEKLKSKPDSEILMYISECEMYN